MAGEAQKKESRLSVRREGNVIVVGFKNSILLDALDVQETGEELLGLVGKGDRFLISFKNVDFLSSAFIGKLITFMKRLREKHGELKLCDIKPSILTVFKITKLDTIIEIHEAEIDALAAFR